MSRQALTALVCVFALVLIVAFGSGCASAPRVKLPGGASAIGPRDIGTPARVESSGTVSTLPIPAQSTVAAMPATQTAPAHTVVTLAAPSVLRTETHADTATTGTVDTTVAVKRIETESAAAERRWLLWAAIGCGVAGLVLRSLLPSWPGISNGLLVGAVAAGAAWKLAEVPAWIWLLCIAAAGLLALGYKRAEWDANGDGIPDVLQRK